MSRTRTTVLGLTVAVAAVAVLEATSHTGPLVASAEAPSEQLLELLNGIDFVPDTSTLPSGAEDDIRSLAADTAPTDPGLRIRALRALSHYPGAETTTVLESAIDDYAGFNTGIETLYLRAAMRALAKVDGSGATPKLSPLLNNASRDVRASAAESLAISGDPQAILILRQRLNIEQVPQVRLAIAEAIRQLTGS